MILLALSVTSILALVTMYAMGINFNRSLQGFQSGAGAPAMNTFTMYYADWCGHCQTAKPEFTTFSQQGTITVGNQSCKIRRISPEHEPDSVKGKHLKGYPSFLLETVDGQTVEYTGERNTAGYMSFLNANLGTKSS